MFFSTPKKAIFFYIVLLLVLGSFFPFSAGADDCSNHENCYCNPLGFEDCRSGFSVEGSYTCPTIGRRTTDCCCGNCAIQCNTCYSYDCCAGDGICTGGRCKKSHGWGESCNECYYCGSGLTCISGTCCKSGAHLAGGETCYCDADCAGGNCSGGKCVEYVGLGDDCSSDWVFCSSPGADCIGGRCKKPHGWGESCNNSYYCSPSSLTCVSGVCCKSGANLAGGETCYCDVECTGGDCTGGRCSVQKDKGEGCSQDWTYCSGSMQCVDGVCVEANKGRGENCGSYSLCDSGLLCSDQTGKCYNPSLYLGEGNTCYDDQECSMEFCKDGVCVFSMKISDPLETNEMTEILDTIFDFIFYTGVVVCPLLVVIGGIIIATSGGDITQADKGKKIIFWSALGLAITLISKGVWSAIRSIIPF